MGRHEKFENCMRVPCVCYVLYDLEVSGFEFRTI